MGRFLWLKYILAGCSRVKVLKQLALSGIGKIRCRVAENDSCPAQLLFKLSTDESADVRMAVALNRRTGIKLLVKLSRDMQPDVRYMMASTSYLPIEILCDLAMDDNPYVQARATNTLRALSHSRQIEQLGGCVPQRPAA